MIERVYTAEEICKAIAADFKMRGLTHGAAAEMLGLCKQTVSNQISGKKKFSLKALRGMLMPSGIVSIFYCLEKENFEKVAA